MGKIRSNGNLSLISDSPGYHNPYKSIEREAKAVEQALLAEMAADGGDGKDLRMTPADLNRGVLRIMKAEPMFYLAALIKRCLNPRSKLDADPDLIRRMLIDLHDRMYPSPAPESRKPEGANNQFQLEFAWNDDGGGGKVATMSEDDCD